MSLGDGRPAVTLTFWMRSSGQTGFDVVFEIVVGQLPWIVGSGTSSWLLLCVDWGRSTVKQGVDEGGSTFMFCVDEAGSTVHEDGGREPWVAGPRGSGGAVCVYGVGSLTMSASLDCSRSCVVEFLVCIHVQLSFLYDLPNNCSASSLCSVSSSSAQRTVVRDLEW